MFNFLQILYVVIVAIVFFIGFYFFRKLSSTSQSKVVLVFLPLMIIYLWINGSQASLYPRILLTIIFSIAIIREITKLKKATKP